MTNNMPHTPPETIEERIGAFAQINDFYQRGVPMGKLVAFIKEEITRAKEEGGREAYRKIEDIAAEFNRDPKETLGIIGEHVGLALHNTGPDN